LRAIREALFGSNATALMQRFSDPDLFEAPQLQTPTRGRGRGAPRALRGGMPNLPGLPSLPALPGLNGLPEFDIIDDLCPPWRGKKLPWPDWVPWKPPPLPRWPWPIFVTDWVSAGPTNFSGRIKSLAVNPANGTMLYAGAADGGVWRSANGGTSWTALMFTELSMAIGSIAVAASNPNIIYAATGEDTPGWGPSYPGVGVYASSDAGATWTLYGNGVVGDRCSRIVVDPGNANRVFVASNTGLWRSADGGATWTRALAGHISDVVLDPVNTNRLWAAIWLDGIWQTVDGGATWSRSGRGQLIVLAGDVFWLGRLPTGSTVEWIKLAQGLNGTGGRDVLVAKMGTNSGDIYRTTDGGVSWFRVATGVEGADYNEWTSMIALHPSNNNIMIAGGVGISRATNGTTFTSVGGTHSDHHQVVFDPIDPNVCWMATDGGVYRSTDAGASWTLRSARLGAAQLYSIGVSQSGTFLLGAATQDQGIIASDGPSAWRDTGAGNEGGFFVVDPNDGNNVYACPWDADLVRSTDRAFTWGTIRSGMVEWVGPVLYGPANVDHVAVRPGNSDVLLAAGRLDVGPRLFRSINRGDSWTRVLTPSDAITRVAFAPSNGARVYAATAGGRLHRSSSAGTSGSWIEPSASPPSLQAITALAVDWSNRDVVWIGAGGYSGQRVRRSTDGGATWTDATGVLPTDQLPALPVNAIVVDQNNPDIVYVANDIGVFRTRDGGQAWDDFSDGFLNMDVPRILVTGLELRRSTNTLYASTMGRGAYRRQLG